MQLCRQSDTEGTAPMLVKSIFNWWGFEISRAAELSTAANSVPALGLLDTWHVLGITGTFSEIYKPEHTRRLTELCCLSMLIIVYYWGLSLTAARALVKPPQPQPPATLAFLVVSPEIRNSRIPQIEMEIEVNGISMAGENEHQPCLTAGNLSTQILGNAPWCFRCLVACSFLRCSHFMSFHQVYHQSQPLHPAILDSTGEGGLPRSQLEAILKEAPVANEQWR